MAVALALCAPALAAQEPGAPIPLDSLSVTVLRGTVDPRTAPFAVTVLGPDELTHGRVPVFLEDALEAVPGLQLQNRFNFAQGERLAVRGQGARAQFGVRGVRIVVDGIPATLPDGQSTLDVIDLAALGSAEVLRGPAAALHGNASGGVLLLRSLPPAPGPFEPAARAVTGSHGLRTLSVSGSGTVGETGYAAGAGWTEWTGFRTLAADPSTTYGDASRRIFTARAARPLGSGTLRLAATALEQSGENPGALPPPVFDTASHAWANNVRQRTGETNAHAQVGLSWTGPTGPLATELAGWVLGRSTEGPIPTSILDLDRRGFGVRAVVGSRGGAAGWDLGASVERQRDDRRNFANEEGRAGALTLDQLETVTGAALFGQLHGEVLRDVRALIALRVDRFRFAARDRLVGGANPDDSGERTMAALSPSAGVVWSVDERAVLFGNVASFLETPTTTELANRPEGAGGFNPELDPARGLSAELGVRGALGPRLRYELVGFRSWLADELVAFEVPEAAGRTFYRNAGSSRHTGFEAMVDLRPGGGTRLRVSHSRITARFRSYAPGGVDLSGNRIPGVAPSRWEGLFGIERGPAFVELSGEWMGRIPVDDANTARTPAHRLLDVRAGVDGVRLGGLALGLYGGVANLTDARYVSSVVVNAFGSRWFEPGPGRTWHLGVSSAWAGR